MPDTAPFAFDAYMAERVAWIDSALDRFLPTAETPPAALHAAMRYSLLGGSAKRVRPLLCIAGAEAIGGDAVAVLPTACALEMIHTFSLIHDDLPAIDNDDYRRGILTAHRKFGEGMAILAGDALHTQAFLTVAQHQTAHSSEQVLRVISLLAESSGTLGMVGGQVDDIFYEGRAVDGATLQGIHARKTGALLNAAILSGAILSGATIDQEASLRTYGDQVGLAFQIVDDILDVTGDAAKLGKPIGSDAKNDKATYPKVYGLDESHRLAHRAANAALDALTDFDTHAEPLRAFARFIVERDA